MKLNNIKVDCDLAVVGAGMSGICAAIEAARSGLKVALINNRGFLGGNASPEIRIHVCGADGSAEFNFYARETGILEEIRLENLYRNPQGNNYIWHTVLLDWVLKEKNIELFLNTNIDEVITDSRGSITCVCGSQIGSEKHFEFISPFFVDDTGDGTIGYLAGGEYRIGRESRDEFNERIAPEVSDDHTILSTLSFYSKETGQKAPFTLPDFADNTEVLKALKHREIPDRIPGDSRYDGYRMQWFYETGYDKDQISDAETIIQDHRELIYSIWDHIKNSGKYPSETFDLEYVSPVPGKRESRRLVGDHILTENDIVDQTKFEDVIGHGGWSIDLHAMEGFFSDDMTTHHYELNGIYEIPLRSCYSKNVSNLFVASRCMSTTHVAFGTTRVQGTLSTAGQAVGKAAAICKKYNITPRVLAKDYIKELQQSLLKDDQYVIGHYNQDNLDLVKNANIQVSSYQKLSLAKMSSEKIIDKPIGLILPVLDKIGSVDIMMKASKDTVLTYKVYTGTKIQNYMPQIKLNEDVVNIKASTDFNWVTLPINCTTNTGKIFIEFQCNENIILGMTSDFINGVLCLSNEKLPKGSTFVDIKTHIVRTDQWTVMNTLPCFRYDEGNQIYNASNINNGYNRNYKLPNLWISEADNESETVTISFDKSENIAKLDLTFDSNLNMFYDNVEIFYDFNVMPQLVKDYKVYAKIGNEYKLVKEIKDNHQRVNHLCFDSLTTDEIKLVLESTNGYSRFSIYEIRAYN